VQQDNGLDKVAIEASTSVWASSEAHMQVGNDHPLLVGLNPCITGTEPLVLTSTDLKILFTVPRHF